MPVTKENLWIFRLPGRSGARRLLFVMGLGVIVSSCGFSHLTEVQNHDLTAPTAEECGTCHVEQYEEWRRTAHARAYVNPEFRRQSDQYQEHECLFCHVPGNIQHPAREARGYNLEEGVTCISCHLHEQFMQGPHESGALFSPHLIARSSKLDSSKDSSQLCGTCHEETYGQWQQMGGTAKFPTCHGCHGKAVERKHTKGTGFFSKILVAFEPVHKVRSHALMLPDGLEPGCGPEIILDDVGPDNIAFVLTNSLPHDLPTGSFGEKELFLIVSGERTPGQAGVLSQLPVPAVLAPGERKRFNIKAVTEGLGQTLFIDLLRRHKASGKERLIRSFTFAL